MKHAADILRWAKARNLTYTGSALSAPTKKKDGPVRYELFQRTRHTPKTPVPDKPDTFSVEQTLHAEFAFLPSDLNDGSADLMLRLGMCRDIQNDDYQTFVNKCPQRR